MKTTAFAMAACFVALALGGCQEPGGFLIRAVPADQTLKETAVGGDQAWAADKIAIVDLDGLIVNQRMTGWFGSGENPVSLLAEKLDKAGADARVKAVVLRINSPGGTVLASEVAYDMVRRFRQRSGKPVIACIADVGASGGYYVACAGDRIVAQPASITGSIGVIIQTVSFAGTMRLLGITADAVTSGPHKEMGSPLKPLSEEDRKLFQGMVDQFYGRFVDVVARSRTKLPREKVRELADGRVYTGQQALELGLVDQLGDMELAMDEAKKAARLTRARLVMYHRPLGYRGNAYAQTPAPAPVSQVNLINVECPELMTLRRPAFLYLWTTDLSAP